MESNSITAGLKINRSKYPLTPVQLRRQLGFDVEFEPGKCKEMGNVVRCAGASEAESFGSLEVGRDL